MTRIKAWIFAARPRTLAGAVAPVAVSLAAAWRDIGNPGLFAWTPAVLCLIFALLMQIDANFINDYYDCKKGRDDGERLGPERACAQGWITTDSMWRGIVITSVLACLTGLPLIFWGGFELIAIGALCLIGAFLYTTHLAQRALGDLLVIVFFGIVPVCVTYYIQVLTCPLHIVLVGLAVGLATECLLLINNYRDRDDDTRHGKRTLVVLIGERPTEFLYASCGIAAVALVAIASLFTFGISPLWPMAYLLPHFATTRRMHIINHGRELNLILAQTARNILIFAALTTLSILI